MVLKDAFFLLIKSLLVALVQILMNVATFVQLLSGLLTERRLDVLFVTPSTFGARKI